MLDCFADEAVTPEEMEDVYARLEKRGVQILAEEGTVHLRMKDFFWKKMGMILRIPYQN